MSLKISILVAFSALILISHHFKNFATTAASVGFSNQEQEDFESRLDDLALASSPAAGRPINGGGGGSGLGYLNSYRGGKNGISQRSMYNFDPSFIPYIHPRFVYEEDFPSKEVMLTAASANKRATKGMLVDVVDFVTKGSGNRSQRLGQEMRSSGRK